MTTDQIHELFNEKIEIKGIHKILEVDKFGISNYRRRKDELSLGLKLELLLKMGEIEIYPKQQSESTLDGGSSIQDFNKGKVVDPAYNINGYIPKSEAEEYKPNWRQQFLGNELTSKP